jgi:hypothetical protein
VPEASAHAGVGAAVSEHGTLWLQSQALDFIWRLNDRTAHYLHKLRLQMGRRKPEMKFPFEQETIGMHIRRGDSFMAARWMPGPAPRHPGPETNFKLQTPKHKPKAQTLVFDLFLARVPRMIALRHKPKTLSYEP